jgi:hypothetical protein
MKLGVEKTSSDLVKVMVEKVSLQTKFSKIKKKHDEAMQKFERMKKASHKV